MKTIIVLLVVGMVLLISTTAFASVKLLRGAAFAQVGVGGETITVYRVKDGDTMCYVTKQGQYGAHAISCVK